MAQSNKFRGLWRSVIDSWPKEGMTPQLRANLENLAAAEDALATMTKDVSQPANTQESGSGGGGSAAAGLRANAASHVGLASVPKYLSTGTSLKNQHPYSTPRTAYATGGMAQAPRQDSHMDGYPSVRVAIIADGENVQPGDALTILGNKAYLATAADVTRRCNAMAVRGTGVPGEIVYTRGGTAVGRIVGDVDNTQTGVLYLSVTPGKLTFDEAESPGTKLFSQEVGFYDVWLDLQNGDATPSAFEFAFFPFPPYSTL